MSAAQVSVVITNYNYRAYLGQAIRSALGQMGVSTQVIVVDDGSTDGSTEIARRFPVRLIEQRNSGVAAARNAGAAVASAGYLMFLDADDVLEPDYLRHCINALQPAPPHIAYAYTQMQLFGSETKLYTSRPFNRGALLKANFVHASALMRRARFVESGGYDSSWTSHEDYELWIRLLSMGYSGVFVPMPLLRYRQHCSGRNRVDSSAHEDVKWRIRGTYPQLYRRQCLLHPRKMAYWIHASRFPAGLREK